MIGNDPTEEHTGPEESGESRSSTETGRPRPSEPPAYPRPQAVPDPPPPQPAPPPQPQPYAYPLPPPQPYATPYQQPPAPPHQYPPAPQPPQTVHGGGGTLWLRPESGVTPVPGPAPAGGAYLGAPQATPYPPGYMAAPVPAEPSNGKAVAALVLGIVGLFFLLSGLGILFFVNLPCSILAWIFGVQGKRLVDQGVTTKGDGMAKTGLWMGVAGTILGVLAIAIWIVAIAASA